MEFESTAGALSQSCRISMPSLNKFEWFCSRVFQRRLQRCSQKTIFCFLVIFLLNITNKKRLKLRVFFVVWGYYLPAKDHINMYTHKHLYIDNHWQVGTFCSLWCLETLPMPACHVFLIAILLWDIFSFNARHNYMFIYIFTKIYLMIPSTTPRKRWLDFPPKPASKVTPSSQFGGPCFLAGSLDGPRDFIERSPYCYATRTLWDSQWMCNWAILFDGADFGMEISRCSDLDLVVI